MTSVFISDTQRKDREDLDHVKTEAEKGVTHSQVKEQSV